MGKYRLITAVREVELESQVSGALAEGWVPWGGVAIATEQQAKTGSAPRPAIIYFAQAMVKES